MQAHHSLSPNLEIKPQLTSAAMLARELVLLPGSQHMLLQPLACPTNVRALRIVQPAVGPDLHT